MNLAKKLACMLAVLMAAQCVQADTIIYDFDDGTFQGWVHDERATLEWHVWDTAADDNGGVFISHTGDFAVRIEDWGIRDNNTDLLMITSPEFKISAGATVEFWGLGGMGSVVEPTWSNYDNVPTTATSGGFMGIALRRVSDGQYILFGRRDRNSESDNDPSWSPIEWTAADIAAAVASDSPAERYVIDVIDTYTGGWGWFGFDEVILTNVKVVGNAVADNPSPEDGAVDVATEPTLQWTVGEYADTHDVYLGADFDDVNNATTDSDLYMGRQSGTEFAPGRLELGVTYYWRIDEVNAAPDFTVFKGETWSFTVEPFAYVIEGVTATSNGVSEPTSGPEKMVDGSGLNEADQHSTLATDMWLASPADEALSVVYEFDRIYKLHEMVVWNYNVQFELLLGFGLKSVTLEYSENGADWTLLGDADLNQATALDTYEANTAVAFGGVPARFVRLTVNGGWGPMGQFGLSEVQFTQIPAAAREPQPADGAVDVSIETMLTWRPGREAVSHEVSFGAPDALALVDTVGAASFDPGTLDLQTTYAWRIDEVNEADAVTLWPGALWSFTTQAHLVVDDFEVYDDEDNRIYQSWVDGYGVSTNGSTVGHLESPFAEQTVVKNGKQAMPLFYDNSSAAMSEAELALSADFSASGIKSLTLSFHGATDNTGGQLYVKINGTKIAYDGVASKINSTSWNLWSIDLATVGNVTNVTSLIIGVEGAGASGVVYIDDVRLYPEVLAYHRLGDITSADDTVQGVPNDGDWPDTETPALVIDDDVTTKYLHRKGGTVATGIQITPAAGSTVVTGITFTTANDAPSRDPIAFELSGSNAGIEGPYTLIASGDVVDFAGETDWPRFTKNDTVIVFDNDTAYTHYQIVFPTLHGEGETLMQIAEIELIGH